MKKKKKNQNGSRISLQSTNQNAFDDEQKRIKDEEETKNVLEELVDKWA